MATVWRSVLPWLSSKPEPQGDMPMRLAIASKLRSNFLGLISGKSIVARANTRSRVG